MPYALRQTHDQWHDPQRATCKRSKNAPQGSKVPQPAQTETGFIWLKKTTMNTNKKALTIAIALLALLPMRAHTHDTTTRSYHAPETTAIVQDIQEQISTAQYTPDSAYHIAFSTMHSCDRVIERVSREYLYGLELIDTGHHVDVCVGVLWSNDSF